MIGMVNISRVSDQNGVSLLYIMLEIHHSGWKPSIWIHVITLSVAFGVWKSSVSSVLGLLSCVIQCHKFDPPPDVPTLLFWAEDLPLYVISPVLPFDRKISR